MKKLLVITQINPLHPKSGVSVILNNLFKSCENFDYKILFLGRDSKNPTSKENDLNAQSIFGFNSLAYFTHILSRRLKNYLLLRKAIKICKAYDPTSILGLYPTYNSLKIAYELSIRIKKPFFPWFHDTCEEGLKNTIYSAKASLLEKKCVENILSRRLKNYLLLRKAVKICKAYDPTSILGLYPTYNSLKIAYELSIRIKKPFFPWFHDTCEEGLKNTIYSAKASLLEKKCVEKAETVFVMHDGLVKHFNEKYNIKSTALRHPYPEKISKNLFKATDNTSLWGGDIYRINDKCVTRLSKLMKAINYNLVITTLKDKPTFNYEAEYTSFPKREDYLKKIRETKLLLMGVNWADECSVHEKELNTIFPTKCIEYLAMGCLIVAHCPPHSFLARFITKYSCGYVLSDRDFDKNVKDLSKVLKSEKTVELYRKNAIKAASIFETRKIMETLVNNII